MPVIPLSNFPGLKPPSTTDRVFEALYAAVIRLELPPGSKVSEAELAKNLGVSRQPVRDAFYRLSELGLLRIRPQRATTITLISERAVLDAHFIRTAIELACVRAAIEKMDAAGVRALEDNLHKQSEALAENARMTFHKLDDAFHRMICEIAGHSQAWSVIRDQKVHMDRVRYLSLAGNAPNAFADHLSILDAMKARDTKVAEERLNNHLSNIFHILESLRESNLEHFERVEG